MIALQCVAPLVALLSSMPRGPGPHMRVDSTADSVCKSSAVFTVVSGDSLDSKIGKVLPAIIIGCTQHEEFGVNLLASVAPAVIVRHSGYWGEQAIEVQADSNKKQKINTEIVTFGRERLMVMDAGDDKKMLIAMASAQMFTVEWKLWDYEAVVGRFTLDTNETDRRAKLAAPWLSCKKKPLW